jgi:CDP-diacylglycerol--serine O-phosphatidyltransferase
MTQPSDDPVQGNLPLPRRRRLFRPSMAPTVLTMANLVCGFLAIAYMTDAHAAFGVTSDAASSPASRVVLAGWMILLGMVFDMLDGRVARMTRSTSEFGGILDCLADLVTFGVAPALVAKVVIQDAFVTEGDPDVRRIAFLTAAFYAVCAALRLARYAVEQEDDDNAVETFVGLPTPGAAGVIATLALNHERILGWWTPATLGKWVAAYALGFGVVAALALLMVSTVPFAHLANRFLGARRSVGRVALVLFVVMALMVRLEFAVVLAVVFGAYALSGPLFVLPRLFRKRREVSVTAEFFD